MSTDISGLLFSLAERGVTLEVDGDLVRVRGPKGALTPELQAALAAAKPALLELLREKTQDLEETHDHSRDLGDRTPARLSPGQRSLWLIGQLAKGTAPYQVLFGVRMTGPLDRGALEW